MKSVVTGLIAALCVVWGAGSVAAQGGDAAIERRLQEMETRHAQDIQRLRQDYEGRIDRLENTVTGLRGELDVVREEEEEAQIAGLIDQVTQQQQQPGRRVGIGDFGQTNIFDNFFNPAISVASDFVFSATNLDDSFGTNNRFTLRSLELGFVGRVDPLLAYYVYIHFAEDEVELEEAFGRADNWLPDTFEIKFGRYNIDFGKLSPIHDHDLPMVDKPQVLQEYLGGSLRGTGAALHHDFVVGDSHLMRWSLGVVNGLDGDSHSIFGPAAGEHEHGEEEGADPFGERDIENFAFTARVTGLFELSERSTLQVGSSLAWAPEDRRFFGGEHEHGEEGKKKKEEEEAFAVDLERLILGFDITYKWRDQASGEGLTLQAEAFLSNQEFFEEEEHDEEGLLDLNEPEDVSAWGFYGLAIWQINRNWSVGASGGWFQHAEDDDEESWDAGAFVTWNVNEFNRLRLEIRYFDDPGEEYWAGMLQWTLILGSHGHGLDF